MSSEIQALDTGTAPLWQGTVFACVAAVFAAFCCSLCALGFVLMSGPALFWRALRAWYFCPRFSLKLKLLNLPVLIVLTLLAAIVLLPAMFCYGLFVGFSLGYALAKLTAITQAYRSCASMLASSRSDLQNQLVTQENWHMATDELAWDLPLARLLGAVLGGTLASVIFALGLCIYSLVMLPPSLIRVVYQFLRQSSQALPIRLVLALFSPLCGLLLLVITPLASLIYGLIVFTQSCYLDAWLSLPAAVTASWKRVHHSVLSYLF